MADTIPIYWGNPAITEMFNKKAFINVHEYKSLDKLLEEVISLDNDDEKYFTMLNEPIFCENSLVKEKEEFVAFILNIFEQNHKEAFRRNQTGWEDWYEDRLREDIKNRDIVSKLNSIWGKIPGPIRNIIKRI